MKLAAFESVALTPYLLARIRRMALAYFVAILSVSALTACGRAGLSRTAAFGLISQVVNRELVSKVDLPSNKLPDEDLLTDALYQRGLVVSRGFQMALSPDGERFALVHGWRHKPAPFGDGEEWLIPYASVRALRVVGIRTSDHGDATVEYTYNIEPNELGKQILALRSNASDYEASSWSQIDQWGTTQRAIASFKLYDDGWRPVTDALGGRS